MNEEILLAIRGRLRDRGLDAYIAYTPSNVFYTTGFQSYFLMQWWRMQGTVLPDGIERLHKLPHELGVVS